MRHRYFHLDPDLLRQMLAGIDLMRLFNQLLLASAGDPEEAMEWMRYLQEQGYIDESVDLEAFFAELEKQRLLERDDEGGLVLSGAGERQHPQERFRADLLRPRQGRLPATTRSAPAAKGSRRCPRRKPYAFGDDLARIDSVRSLANALKRTQGELELAEEDLEVLETEHMTACATVVAIDISHSMILYGEDRITPAKTVALALTELITTKYPKDHLSVITFGDRAERIAIRDLPYLEAGPFHTNTREALALARGLLARQKQPNKQIILITDGKPSAITENGQVYKNPFGLDLRIVNLTLEEADLCRRQKIVITTFMIATDSFLQQFVDQLTKVNRGRAYFASPDNLGEFLLADYIRNRKSRVR